jgi:hypothetical protein
MVGQACFCQHAAAVHKLTDYKPSGLGTKGHLNGLVRCHEHVVVLQLHTDR